MKRPLLHTAGAFVQGAGSAVLMKLPPHLFSARFGVLLSLGVGVTVSLAYGAARVIEKKYPDAIWPAFFVITGALSGAYLGDYAMTDFTNPDAPAAIRPGERDANVKSLSLNDSPFITVKRSCLRCG